MEEKLSLSIKRSESCPIYIQESLDGLKDLILEKHPLSSKVLIVSDSNILPIYETSLKDELKEMNVYTYCVDAGEASKSMDNALKILAYMTKESFARTDLILALGGGVVGDLCGFVAGLYMRGISFIQLPTSLLSMVDSSIGGKCAVNDQKIKNNIGLFYLPSFVYINPQFLNSLPGRQYFAGFSEIMKIALACDKKFYVELLENMYEILDMDMTYVMSMIEKAIMFKKTIVEKDFTDCNNIRAILNLGHTFAHAFEMVFPGEFYHGEAVALGCVAASFVSWKKGLIKMEDYYEIRDMFVPFHQPISLETDTQTLQKIFDKMKQDKKNTNSKITLVLLKSVGKAYVDYEVEESLIMDALNEINFTEN